MPPEVWIGGYAVAGPLVALSVRRFDERHVPQVAVLTSLFFVASLVHVPLAVTSVHLLLAGLLGIVLGILSLPAVFVALFFQAILLGQGGLTTIGVNTITMGSGALAARGLYLGLAGLRAAPSWKPVAAFAASVGGTIASSLVFLGVMVLGGTALGQVGAIVLVPHLVVAVLDALVTASTVAFLLKVKPDLLPGARPARPVLAGALAVLLLLPAALMGHDLDIEARVEGDIAQVRASFDGDPAPGVRVTVRPVGGAAEGPPLFEGCTDAAGVCSFSRRGDGPLSIEAEDGAGHHAELVLQPGQAAASSPDPGLSDHGPRWLRAAGGIGGILVLSAVLLFALRRRRGNAP